MDVCWHAVIEFPTDEEAHNDDLQAAARAFADSILALVKAGARDVWGEPDYNLSCADEELPAWAEDLPNGPGFERLVGWRRGRTLVAFALREQQDRETPIFVFVGVVRWRAGALANEEKQRGGVELRTKRAERVATADGPRTLSVRGVVPREPAAELWRSRNEESAWNSC